MNAEPTDSRGTVHVKRGAGRRKDHKWVWSHLKQHELAGYAPHDVRELRRGVRLSVLRMRVRPNLIRSFVAASHLYD